MREISHDGIVESIDSDGHLRVRITQTAACEACKVAGHCQAAEQKVKTVDVYLPGNGQAGPAMQDGPDHRSYRVGDSVVVATGSTTAARALLLGFALPLLLLLTVLAAMLTTGRDEDASAVAALATLPPYYFMLWLFRKRIAGSISFRLTSTNQ